MTKKIELLAPGGDIDSIIAAIIAGADAVYCGLEKFNARNRATNISLDDLRGVIRFAHLNSCKIFVTLNIIVFDNEFPALISLLNKLSNFNIDGIIVQDLGLFHILSKYFKNLEVHASTQATTHNTGQIQFLKQLNVTRINLSRELNIHEIKGLTSYSNTDNIETEVFVHGSYCISFSGLCYISSVQNGNSGNRGRCSQPCRDEYLETPAGKKFPLNLKDNSAFENLDELIDAGVTSLKIEGRIKKYDYVYTVVKEYQSQLQGIYKGIKQSTDKSELYKVFNRDFSNAFLKGEISKELYIDNPRDHSVINLLSNNNYNSEIEKENLELDFYNTKELSKEKILEEIHKIDISKLPLSIKVSGEEGTTLKVKLISHESSVIFNSEKNLSSVGKEPLSIEMIIKRFKAFNETDYIIKEISLSDSVKQLYLPYKELSLLKSKILFHLNNNKEEIPSVEIKKIPFHKQDNKKPSLSVIISSIKEYENIKNVTDRMFFRLPNSLGNQYSELLNFLSANKNIHPWFPSVLIGDEYSDAIRFIKELNPRLLVTENTGIAYEAYKKNTPWIAGPCFNIINSFSLQALKNDFNCSGAYISNELKKDQIKQIKKPSEFDLFYSIYHPINLMTSRQCFFHQVSGCEKQKEENTCIQKCERHSSIKNLKGEELIIRKEKGCYNTLLNEYYFLNIEIISDLPNLFTDYSIDLSNSETNPNIKAENPKLIALFNNAIKDNQIVHEKIKKVLYPTTNSQYLKGI